mgnify:CR=1 FL=1|tara:strand:- start:55 stop:336 length:282 start_codon:yes stop_codon:yes gene_type:complete
MKVFEIMERAGISQTGRAIAYIKDALEEINMISETHVRRERIDIKKDQRFYQIPNEAVRLLEVRAKNHNNNDNRYQALPRMIYKPEITDADGE